MIYVLLFYCHGTSLLDQSRWCKPKHSKEKKQWKKSNLAKVNKKWVDSSKESVKGFYTMITMPSSDGRTKKVAF